MQNAPREHSAILSTFIKLLLVIKIFVLSIFEWPLKTGLTIFYLYFLFLSIGFCETIIGFSVARHSGVLIYLYFLFLSMGFCDTIIGFSVA